MKKYVKPELFYESFELSQHIANCQWELDHASKETCVATGEDGTGYENNTLFMSYLACEWTADDGMYEDYCYHSGADGNLNVFAS